MKYIVLLCLLGYIYGSDGVQFDQNLEECNQMGLYCSSCKDLALCAGTDYGLIKQHVQTCPQGQYCSRGRCNSNRNPLCDGTANIPFKCHVPGIFPDPFECQYYHHCVISEGNRTNEDLQLEDYKLKCQDGEGGQKYKYNAKTTFCDISLGKNGDCGNLPVPICFHIGDTAALEENDSIYFVCVNVHGILYPQLFSCPHGQVYNPDLKECGFWDTTKKPY